MAKRVVIFTSSTCGACRQAKSWLQQHGVDYAEYSVEDVEVQEELRNLERQVGTRLSSIPVVVVNGKVYEGFDPGAFERILADEV